MDDAEEGVALLSIVHADAAGSYTKGRTPTPDALANAAIHSYTTAFAWAGAIFAVGAVLCGLLVRPGAPDTSDSTDSAAAIST
ncbi:hypothetical protein [Streptomyces sp. STR69]|uniref:hypothetical protein n=1 Tax=Streptomyces sp. STR69 TaxID=1796942 RepID=UPI0021C7E5CE|nr:hypothetical protein [Streptomyces sp. STR69]